MPKPKSSRTRDFDPSAFITPADLDMKRIQFECRKWIMEYRMDLHSFASDLQFEQIRDEASRHMVLTLLATVASRKLAVKTVSFPDGPWQWVKWELKNSRYASSKFVRWLIKKYPVRQNEITLTANAYDPEIAIPDKSTFVEICVKSEQKW